MGSVPLQIKGKKVTIELTPEQRKHLAAKLGVHWEEVTFSAPQIGAGPKALKPDVNIVVALGQTKTIS